MLRKDTLTTKEIKKIKAMGLKTTYDKKINMVRCRFV